MHPAHDNPHVSISPANLKIATAGGSIIVTPVNGTPITLTSDAVDLLANDSMPAGLTEKLNKAEQKEIVEFAKLHVANRSNHGASLYIPGPIHIVEALTGKYRFRTIPELGTDHEKIFYYNGQIYERAETVIKSETHAEYIKQWSEQLKLGMDADNKNHITKMKRLLDRGPSANDINEVLQMIRRTTFTHAEMNPPSHIPFQNGLLNLQTRRLEPFSAELFFIYQIDANLLDRHVTLKDMPLFGSLLNGVFYAHDIPMVLSYAAYAMQPSFPVHKVLFIPGRERVGKGTFVRVIQGLMPKGSGSLSLARLLTGERFQFSGIEGKNLLIDSEAKRKFRRGTVLDWTAFCNLFGGDILNVEPKGRDAHDYISKSKGIVLGNLPFVPVDSPPAVARILVVETRNERPLKVIPNLDEKILESERDLIVTLLTQVMFRLEDRNYQFPGQLTDDATGEILDRLSDPVANFVDERTEYQKGASVGADDAYAAFTDWCGTKGIPPLTSQSFKKAFSRHYIKKRERTGTSHGLNYVYIDCQIIDAESGLIGQGQLQVGTEYDAEKTLKISRSGDRYRMFQHEHLTPRVRKERDHDHIHDTHVKGELPKLEQCAFVSGEPINTAPGGDETCSNLKQDLTADNSPGSAELTADPVKPSPAIETWVEHPPITEENGRMIIDQLLSLGYHIDPDSGRNIDRKYYKIGVLGLRSLPADQREKLESIMRQEGFKMFNTGGLGIFWYVRPLARDTGGKPQ